MIHIGTVHVNGRKYNLELNHPGQPRNESGAEPGNAAPRRNFPPSRSEIFLLNSNRKSTVARPVATVRAIEDLRRLAELRRQDSRHSFSARWKIDRQKALTLVARFLSWCFPVREFKSPFQRVLYLSIEKPKAKYRDRYLLP